MNAKFTEKVYNTADAEYERTFWNAMRGRPKLLDEQQIGKDESTGTHIMPIGASNKYRNKLNARSAFRDIASVFDTYDSSYKFIARDTEDKSLWVPETGEIPISEGTTEFDATMSQCKKLASIVKLESSFLYDVGFDLENYLIDRLSKTFARGEDDGFINGNGETSAFGILHPEHGAVTGVETDSLTFDDITSLYLRNLKDDAGNFLWRGSEDNLLGRPVRISNFMPSAESGKCPVAFGDFSYYWIVVRRPLMVRVLAEAYALQDKIGYLAIEMLDGFLIRRKAIKTIKIR